MKIKNKFASAFAFAQSSKRIKQTPRHWVLGSAIATFTILLFLNGIVGQSLAVSPAQSESFPIAQTAPASEATEQEEEIRELVETEVDNSFRRHLALLSLLLLVLLLLNTLAAVGVWFLLRKLAQKTAVAEQEIESLKADTLYEMERVLEEARTVLYQLNNKNDLATATLETLNSKTAYPVVEAVLVEPENKVLVPASVHEDKQIEGVSVNGGQSQTATVENPAILELPATESAQLELSKNPFISEEPPVTDVVVVSESPLIEVKPAHSEPAATLSNDPLKKAIDYTKQGDKLFLENQLEQAVQRYDEALNLQPDLAEVWNNRGVALTRLQRYQEAIASYERAIQLRDDYADAWNNRGVALGKLNHYDAAILSYERAIELKPNYMDAWNNRGFAMAKIKKYGEAISSYNQAAKIRPDFYRIWYNKARCYAVQGQVELAIENLKRANKLNSEACKKLVKREPDFDEIRHQEQFQKLNFDS